MSQDLRIVHARDIQTCVGTILVKEYQWDTAQGVDGFVTATIPLSKPHLAAEMAERDQNIKHILSHIIAEGRKSGNQLLNTDLKEVASYGQTKEGKNTVALEFIVNNPLYYVALEGHTFEHVCSAIETIPNLPPLGGAGGKIV